MFSDIVFLVLGVLLLLVGGNYVTDGSVAIARKFRVSSLVIGLTVVSIGSSMPDLVVCLTSTLKHKSELALGDVVGANIFDIMLVFGVMALIRPIQVTRTMLSQDLPMLFLSCAALFFCGDDIIFDHAGANIINRTDGLMLLSLLVIFMSYTLSSARQQQKLEPAQASSAGNASASHPMDSTPVSDKSPQTGVAAVADAFIHPSRVGFGLAWIMVAVGLGLLVIGGNWVVSGASGIALKAGLSEATVGLTVVAFGSASPDLASSLIALFKGQAGLAVGNVVGSCIINVFGILGFCAVISPLQANNISFVDFSVLAGGALIVWMIALVNRRHTIGRMAGIALTLMYLGYIAYLVVLAASH